MSVRRWMLLLLLSALVTRGAETIRLRGSDTLGARLVPALCDLYRAQHPEVVFEIAAEGAGTAFSSLSEGSADIGMASRVPTEAERAKLASQRVQLQSFVAAHDALAIIVGEKNPVTGLTRRHVEAIFTGEAVNWSALGGVDAPITVYVRRPSSGTFTLFQQLAMSGRDYASQAVPQSDPAQLELMKAKNEFAVTYLGQHSAPASGWRVLPIDGRLPQDPAYAYRTSLYYYIRSDARRAVRDFIDWTQTDEAARAMVVRLGWLLPK